MHGIFFAHLARVNGRLCTAGCHIAALLLAVMLGIVLAQVGARYLFSAPFSWAEELAKTLMVWCAFLVAPWAYRQHQLVAITSFIDALSHTHVRALTMAVHLLVLGVSTLLFGEGLAFVERGWASEAATLPVRLAYFYTVVPVTLVVLMSVAIEHLGALAFGSAHMPTKAEPD